MVLQLIPFFLFAQAAKRTPLRSMCFVSWRNCWERFLWAPSSPAVRLCCEWWLSAMWWGWEPAYVWHLQRYSIFLPFNVIFCFVCLKLVTASAMQAFHRLFSGKPNASTLSPELNAQIITVRAWRDSIMSVNLLGDLNSLLMIHRLCMITFPVRTTCSLCSPGWPSWRKHMFTLPGTNK